MEHTASITWHRQEGEDYIDNKYSRAHSWSFDGGAVVQASASPHIVQLPYSVAANVDPEEAFVAALSSCHMLFFLAIAAKKRLVIDSYVDNAIGYMTADNDKRMMMSKVILRPAIKFAAVNQPTAAQIDRMHHFAHEECFIANSVKTEVVIESS